MRSMFRACLAAAAATALVTSVSVAGASASPRSHVTAPAPVPAKRIVAYYDDGSKSLPAPYTYSARQIPYGEVTDIIYAGIPFDANGKLDIPKGFAEPLLISRAHAAGDKVLLLIGGDIPIIEGHPKMLTQMVNELIAYVHRYNYDGLDLDWEFPATAADKVALLKFFTALRAAFPSPRYLLSIDIAPWNLPVYGITALAKILDWFDLMVYDCAGPWTAHAQLNSPIFWDNSNPAPGECEPGGSDQQAINLVIGHIPAEKIDIGTPFYGYDYTNVSSLFGLCPNASSTPDGACDSAVTTLNYGPNIKKLIGHGWTSYRDPVAQVPYLLRTDGGPGFITYDDPLSTYTRVAYSDFTRGMGGTFMWSLDADYDGHSQDLLRAMFEATHRMPLSVGQ
jgi:chitinase